MRNVFSFECMQMMGFAVKEVVFFYSHRYTRPSTRLFEKINENHLFYLKHTMNHPTKIHIKCIQIHKRWQSAIESEKKTKHNKKLHSVFMEYIWLLQRLKDNMASGWEDFQQTDNFKRERERKKSIKTKYAAVNEQPFHAYLFAMKIET